MTTPIPDRRGPVLSQSVRLFPAGVAALISLAELFTYGGLYFPDTTQFVRHGFYAGFVHKPFHSVIPPAYPLILDGVMVLADAPHRMFVLTVLQQISTVAVTYFVLRIGEVCERPLLGWCAALATAVYIPLGLFAQSAQTETFSVFFVTAASLLFCRGMQASNRDAMGEWMFVASGSLAAVAMAQRPTNLGLLPAALMAFATARVPRRFRLRIAYGAGLLVALGLFAAKNQYHYGDPALVEGVGIHLYGRVAMLDKSLPDNSEARTLREVAQKEGLDGTFFPNAGWTLALALSKHKGMDNWQADAFLRRVALTVFAQDPLRTTRLTYESMRSMVQPVDTGAAHFWGGLHPDTYLEFERIAASSWRNFPEAYREQNDRFPGYPPPAAIGNSWFELFDASAALCQRVVKGTWNIWAMVIVSAVGLVRRQWWVLYFAILPLALLAMAGIGDQPVARYWEVDIPLFFLAIGFGLRELASEAFVLLRVPDRRFPGYIA